MWVDHLLDLVELSIDFATFSKCFPGSSDQGIERLHFVGGQKVVVSGIKGLGD